MNNLAPIVLFVYNRPWHTQQTVEALQKNELASESEIFIYSDAAKNEEAQKSVDEVRKYIDSIAGFKKVTLIKREKNWGLANSIIDGVTKIVNEYGKIIVLEDDLVTSPYFLKFMNEALEFYKDEKKVYSITGSSFTDQIDSVDSTYFLPITSSWSWATWSNKWKIFKQDQSNLKKFIQNKLNHNKFNLNGAYDYISMAKNQLDGKIDSWAIYWYFSVLQKNGLTLYPAKSLVYNIGFDGSGTHCSNSQIEKSLLDYKPILTNNIFEKETIVNKVADILKEQNKTSMLLKTINKLKRLAKVILTYNQKQKLQFIVSKFKLLFYKKKIGKNSYIDKTVNVFGWSNISIGYNTLIGEHGWLNINERVKDFEHIKIGNNCYLGKRIVVSPAKQILINDYALIGDDCKLIGANHIYENPMIPYAFTGAENNGDIVIGVNVWLGTMVCIVGDISIGFGSIIGAGSIVTRSVPPFSIAVGNPCKVIKRYYFAEKKWIDISKWSDDFEVDFPSEQEYLEQMQDNILDVDSYKLAVSNRFGDLI